MSLKKKEIPQIVSIFSILDWADAFILDRKSRGLSPGTICFYQKKLLKFVGYCQRNDIEDPFKISPSNIRNFLIYLDYFGADPSLCEILVYCF